MKKLLTLCLVAALLLCAGCAGDPAVTTPASTPASEAAPTAATESGTLPPETVPAATEAPVPSEPVSTEPPATEAPVTDAPVTQTPAETTAVPEPTEPVDPWSLLGSGGYEAGSYTDDLGNAYDYSYDLPILLADTEGAGAINADIDERFRSRIEEEKEYMKEGLSMGITDIGFHGVVWEDILTVVVNARGYYDDWTDYGIYCYEVSTGRWLDTPMLLAKMGVTQQTFLDRCRTRFHDQFIENYKDLSPEFYTQTGYYEMLARQTTDRYVNLELMAYPQDGELMVIAPILSLAGADYYYEALELGIGGER